MLRTPLPCPRELIVVDDCSTDGSREFLSKLAEKEPDVRLFLHERNGGKGEAIRTAIKHVTGDWAVIQDADLEYDPADYVRLVVPAQMGIADAVFGSRFLPGRYRRAMFYWHTLANQVLTFVTNILNDLNLTDMETCYKLVRADILKNLEIRSKGFDLEPELTTKLTRWGARIYEVPISYQGRTYAEGKKIGAIDALKALEALIKYRFFDRAYSRHNGFMILQAVRRARKFNRWVFSQFKDWLGNEVLEAGCGIGNLTELLLDRKRLVCIDNERFYIERLRQSYGHMSNVRFLEADLTIPEDIEKTTEKGLFDSVLALNVLEHIEDDVTVLKGLRQLLKPGGRVIILVPNDPSLYSKVDQGLGHFRRYSRNDLIRCVEEAGFRMVDCRGFNRLGGFGWHAGKVFGNTTLSTGQMRVFELLMPLVKLLEKVPFHSHNSLLAVGVKEEDGG